MKRWLVALSGLSLTVGLTYAQMQDVPLGHWAYQSIEQLVQLGILEGYPDGTFRPNRTMTRAEFAQAIARAYRNLDERIRALDRRIQEVEGRIREPQPQVNVDELRRQIDELRQQVQELQRLNEAVQTLQRLAQTFQQELAGLGVDVDTLKRDMASLRSRIEALEGKEERVKISGDLTFGVYGTHDLERNRRAYTLDRTDIGTGQLLQEIQVPHELGVTISGQVSDEVTGSATFILGNYLTYAGGSAKSALTAFAAPRTVGNSDLVIWEAFVKAPLDFFGTRVDVTIGRYPLQLTPFTLKRWTPTYYLNFPRYTDGAFRFDGGMFDFNFDTFRLKLFAGQSRQQSNSLNPFNQVFFQNHNTTTTRSMDQMAGARIEFDAVRGEENSLTIGATYFAAGIGRGNNLTFGTINQSTPATNVDRVDVFGGDLKAKFAGFTIGVEYAQSDLLRGDTRVLKKENWALNANIGYNFTENLGLTAGYLEVRPYFVAPGAWGRLGYLYNPSDLKGFYAQLNYKANEDLSFNVRGAFLEGTGKVPDGYTKNDEVTHVVAGIDYRLTERLTLSFNYEGVFWKLGSLNPPAPKPVWNYFTLGVGYNLGENATLNLLYQIIDTDGKRSDVPAVFSGGPNAGRKNSGAVAATTLSIKF